MTKSSDQGRRCFLCGNVGHIAKNCRNKKTESKGHPSGTSSAKKPNMKQVKSDKDPPAQEPGYSGPEHPLTFLQSSDSEDDGHVKQIRVKDMGSRAQLAKVNIQGVPAEGVVDSGADITIMNGELFKHVAAFAHLKKNFKRADKTLRTYDMRPFTLDGQMDLDISFGERTMKTPVYIKMDATTPLLLSEGVYHQLHILSYHPSIGVPGNNAGHSVPSDSSDDGERDVPENDQRDEEAKSQDGLDAVVPMVRVRLLQSTRLLPQTTTPGAVELDAVNHSGPFLVEPRPELTACGLHFEEAVVYPDTTRLHLWVSNRAGFTQTLSHGEELGTAGAVDVLSGELGVLTDSMVGGKGETSKVQQLTLSCETERKEKLVAMYSDSLELPDHEKTAFCDFLADHHMAFCLEDGQRGETDLVQLQIDTGDALPRKQPPRRTPFAVRHEVDRQVKQMQEVGIIQKSHSPWGSPVILVKKKNGKHRFCVDYRKLNEVTRKDTFPLPQIDDLLDQLGQARYSSTLDLAAGYWHIQVAPESRAKTAFVTHRGLYEFNVMPFGLTNAPAVFQRLVQEVLLGLNPDDGPEFVSAYIDDIIIFSRTLKEHMSHLRLVINHLVEAGLKLNPEKCRFIRQEVDYLGHVVTPQGLKPSEKYVQAVKEFPIPTYVSGVRRFLGLASYYRRFVCSFARIAKPLHALTKTNAQFNWSCECQLAFELLKEKLVEAPVLAYPTFDHKFILETDASMQGLGAVLSQEQDDGLIHPVAYASRALSQPE